MTHIVIIGNGISGITTARHVRKRSNAKITVISAESPYFYSRTALMYIYMGHMKEKHTRPYENRFWKENRIDLMQDYVESVDTDNKRLILRKGQPLDYDKLVIATGSKPNYFGWPGQDLDGVQGLYSLQDLEKMEKNTVHARQAVIIGGGLIGIEMAEMLLTRGISVTFLIRETHYWGNILRKEEGELVGRHAALHHVNLKLKTELKEILADDQGRVRAVLTSHGEEIPCQFVGLTAGVGPNIGFIKDSKIETRRGVVVNEYLETNIPDVYAAGDCAEFTAENGRGRLEQLWYTGRMHGEALGATLCGTRTAYDRGIWFNSAKFFDIEYHTYGFVGARPADHEDTLYWERGGNMCFRLVYDKKTQVLIGMNSFGIRYRHKVFERWLGEKRTVEYVLAHLNEANFDPEFFKRFEADIVAHYNKRHPDRQVVLKPRRRFFGFFTTPDTAHTKRGESNV